MPSPLPDNELLNALRGIAPTPPQNLLERWKPPVSHQPLRSRRPWLAGLTAAAACGIAMALLPGSPLRPTPTFAEMEDAILQAKTVSWTESTKNACIFYADGRFEKLPETRRIRQWADLRIPAIGWGSSRFKRVSRDGHTFQISSYKSSLAHYQIYRWNLLSSTTEILGETEAVKLREEIVRSLILPKIETRDSAWKSSSETIDGQEYLKLTKTLPGRPDIGAWRVESIQHTFWVAPDTRRILKQETQTHYRSPKNAVTVVSAREDFRYDETPPTDLFSVKPAVGSRYVCIPQPNRKIKAEDQQAMLAIIHKAEQAWNRGEEKTYLSLWRFHHPSNGSTREEQQAAIRHSGRYQWLHANPYYRAGVRISGVYTHRAGDVFPPKDPVEFHVGPWVLLKESEGFKIVQVHVPPSQRRR